MNKDQVNDWIQGWMDDHSDPEYPDELLDNIRLRVGAVSILQFARDAGLICMDDYQLGLNPIVSRTHPDLGEKYLTAAGLSLLQSEGLACVVCGPSVARMVPVPGMHSHLSVQLFRCVGCTLPVEDVCDDD